MTIIQADTIVTMDPNNTIIRHGAIAFDTTIHAISHSPLKLRKQYPDATLIKLPSDTIIFPALINPHVHLEFSANTTHLRYGEFHRWLDDVISQRDVLMECANSPTIASHLHRMAQTGTATIGAVSSYGYDLEALATSGLRVVYFSEAIGSKVELVETMFSHLLSRIDDAKRVASPHLIPAVAIHSPYSVHPDLLSLALQEAHQNSMVVQAHFMESPEERDWLEKGEGKFAPFFEKFLGLKHPLTTPEKFLLSFEGHRPLFTHAIHTTPHEHSLLTDLSAKVIHCPVSNRLLGAGVAPLSIYDDHNIDLLVGTDGLSSNISLSLFDEMRAGLMLHPHIPLEELSLRLFQGCTTKAAQGLCTNNGELSWGKLADFAVVTIPQLSPLREDFFTQLILQTHHVDQLYIGGTLYERNDEKYV